MGYRRATNSAVQCVLVAASLSTGLLALSPARAQEGGADPFRFLKPWIERQLFGEETPDPNGPSDAPLPGPDGEPPTLGEPAAPSEVAPVDPAPSDSAATAPPTDADGSLAPAPAPLDDALPGTPEDTALPEDAPAQEGLPQTSAAPSSSEERPQPLRFAVLAGRSTAATMAAVGPIGDDLQSVLGRPVEILPLISYGAMIDAQIQRRIDGGFYSAAAYAVADARCACLEPLVAPRAADGTLAYHAVIVVRNGSGIASLADLSGKTIAIGAADSLGARRLQLAGLLAEGIDPANAFGAVLEVQSPEAALSLVASGVVDAAFAWSSLAGDAASGYSRGTLAGVVASGQASMGQLSIIWRSPPIGHGPFATTQTLAEEDKAKIRTYFAGLSGTNPTAYDMLDAFYGGGYAAVDAQDYSGLETLLAQNVDAVRLPGAPAVTGATTMPSAPVAGPGSN